MITSVAFNGETWGANPAATVAVLGLSGLEDWSGNPAAPTNSGDGAMASALRLGPKGFVLSLVVMASTTSEMADRIDAVKLAVYPDTDRVEYLPLTFTIDGQDPKVVFCRCIGQQIPTDFTEGDRFYAAECQFQMEAVDPQVYAASATVSLDPGESVEITGVVPSNEGRWSAVIAGPVTNPQIASDASAAYVARYVGTVPDNSNLVIHVAPGELVTKIVTDADLGDERLFEVGTHCWGSMDNGAAASSVPPRWAPIVQGVQDFTYSASSGAGVCSLTYWVPVT